MEFRFRCFCPLLLDCLWRKLSAEELMLLNCGVGEDSWESLGLQVHSEGDQPWVFFERNNAKAEAPVLWPPHAELTHWKSLWSWEGLRAGGEGDDRGWDGCMASLTWWTWVWVNSGSWLMDREAWHAAIHGIAKSRIRPSDWTELSSVFFFF